MLFLLTGERQTGKTRWLEALVGRLADEGIASYGVVASGMWTRSDSSEASDPRFEKLGIDNVLLSACDVVSFARRRDLAMQDGAIREESQSERLGLGWFIFDEAICEVNDHFEKIGRARAALDGNAAGARAALDGSAADGASVLGESAEAETNGELGIALPDRPSLLVVDELGPLELTKHAGLTSAVGLLDEGPSAVFPHAIAVARKSLLSLARGRFAKTWPKVHVIGPTKCSESEVLAAFGFH